MSATPRQSEDDLPIACEPDESGLTGTVVGGRYRLLRPIAAGGLGKIYEAAHVDLGRRVAIKVLSNDVARNAEAIKRFQREAQTASQLGHPNIIDVHDFGRTADGLPYLVMERLEGHDLDDELGDRETLPLARVLEILAPVASALDAVHAKGIVHRDIKPANIFLARRGDASEQVKLLDFGLAAFHERGDRLTQLGTVVGTPHYMSPEAAEGALSGPEGDVYSLAVVAYECLCGVLPFDAELATGVLVKKVARPAPSMSERTQRPHSAAVEAVLARALSRNPSARPSSAGAFIAELRAAATATEPVEESPAHGTDASGAFELSTPRSRAPEPAPSVPTKRRAPLVVGAIVLLLALVGGGMVLWTGGKPAPSAQAAPPPEPPAPSEPATEVEAPAPPVPDVAAEEIAAAEVAAPEPERVQATARAERAPARRRQRSSEPTTDEPADGARARELVRDAQRALIGGELARARSLFREATAVDPAHAPAWRGLGLAEERMNHAPEAARAYRRYLRLAPRAHDAASVRERLDRLGR